MCKNIDKKNVDKKLCQLKIVSTKVPYNFLYDKRVDILLDYNLYSDVIFARRTEFGKTYTKDELIYIIKSNFCINKEIVCEDKQTYEVGKNNLIVQKEDFTPDKTLVTLLKYNGILPIVVNKEEKNININSIPLIEYKYFLYLPFIIKSQKPKVLLLSDDFGILNYYYTQFYGDKLDVIFMSKNNGDKILEKYEIKIENKNMANVDSYSDILKKFKKIKFDIIIYDEVFCNTKNDCSIPSIPIDFKNLLNPKGIFSINLRSASFYEREKRIKHLKSKFSNLIIMELRICSDFLVCSNSNDIKFDDTLFSVYTKFNDIGFKDSSIDIFKSELESSLSRK